MSHKTAKKVRRAIRNAHLAKSPLLINNKTGQIRRGYGERSVSQRLKRMPAVQREAMVDGLLALAPTGGER